MSVTYQSDEDGREHREDVGLQTGHEQLQNHECAGGRYRPDAHEIALEHKNVFCIVQY